MFIREMTLIYLVILFENFLAHLLRMSFAKRPEVLRSYSNKTMSYQELMDCSDEGKIGSRMIEKVVDEIMRQCIDDIVHKHLDQRFHCGLEQNPKWNKFREIFYRRNMIVHNDGLPNSVYRVEINPRVHTRLAVDKRYLDDAFKVFRSFAKAIQLKLGKSIFGLDRSQLGMK